MSDEAPKSFVARAFRDGLKTRDTAGKDWTGGFPAQKSIKEINRATSPSGRKRTPAGPR